MNPALVANALRLQEQSQRDAAEAERRQRAEDERKAQEVSSSVIMRMAAERVSCRRKRFIVALPLVAMSACADHGIGGVIHLS